MKLLITGGAGLVGSALINYLKKLGLTENEDFISPKSRIRLDGRFMNCDLSKEDDVARIFGYYKPTHVIHLAARVGGIKANLNTPAQQYYVNSMMNNLVLHYSYLFKVKKLIAFSSMCAFSDEFPISEDNLHKGPPPEFHSAYAHAKRMVDIQAQAYNKQYGTNFSTIIPGNIFGENDNYDLENCHVVPAIIRKAYEASKNNLPLRLWGSGQATREFIYVKDLAELVANLMINDVSFDKLIISGKESIPIKRVAEIIASEFNISNIDWQASEPEGQLNRPSDKAKFDFIFPNYKFTDLKVALKNSVDWYKANVPNVRGYYGNKIW